LNEGMEAFCKDRGIQLEPTVRYVSSTLYFRTSLAKASQETVSVNVRIILQAIA
jgi:hypothetical protein